MQPNAKTGKAYRPARHSTGRVGESPATAGARALREVLVDERGREQNSDAATTAARLAKLREVVRRFDALPILDRRGHCFAAGSRSPPKGAPSAPRAFDGRVPRVLCWCGMTNHTNQTSRRAETDRARRRGGPPAQAPPQAAEAPDAAPVLFGTATVGERGQVVIPQPARERYGIRPGDRLVVLGGASGEEGLLLVRAQLVGELLAATVRKLTSFRESVRTVSGQG